ncbi:hypothetical protein KY284_000677 [Solanum tuberosum]|nr:hypothetical protein KY284_000677 [Solanum tuberosum]
MRSVGDVTRRGTLNEITLCQSSKRSYETSGGTVLMDNYATCKIVDIDSVRVPCHGEIVRTIIEVRLVLDLKKNLISLGTLDKQGYKYMSERVTMKVTKGSLVMLKAKLEHGLYTLTRSYEHTKMEMLSNHNLLNGEKINTLKFCNHCILGKQKKVNFSTDKHKMGEMLDYI